ncbi:MHS family MFS transporter [Rhodococcus sp. Z13]|uniref:MHS family MFS transporter n=1 Tax=Rhodococcus sacchari TaxID=2962047 RepID=A0ACD4DCV4_9NOCA|nr:MFS transporter [Rhodococcus sp. Z13]UYP17912.1 MHS family MFS transporter [Rhodococcus sp. Z13]
MGANRTPELAETAVPAGTGATSGMNAERRRVAFATLVGTTVEWYDFLVYAQIAALVFGELFFSGLGQWSQLTALATTGVSFIFRPLGAILSGYLGDRFGRRIVLVLTLGLMGLATTLVGLLPTAASIGIAAPILLIALRCLQGLSAGGEWGGAAMLAVEHAGPGRRGRMGAFPQMGMPLGMMLAIIVMAVVNAVVGKEAFDDWGWRIPFLLSVVLVLVGHFVRSRVAESPVFAQLEEAHATAKTPLRELVRHNFGTVLTAAGTVVGNMAAGYMIVGGFALAYSTKTHGLERNDVLVWLVAATAVWIACTYIGAWWSDRAGRPIVYRVGYTMLFVMLLPQFWLLSSGTLLGTGLAVVTLAIPLGLTYGPQSALFAEMFPAKIRLSGVSLAYAVGAVFGGAFAPTIAEALTKNFDSVMAVAPYLMVMALVSLGVAFLIPDRSKESLSSH